MIITSDELYLKLPDKFFYFAYEINSIREYSVFKRFPTCKYELYSILEAWYKLVRDGLILIDDTGLACKKETYDKKLIVAKGLFPIEILAKLQD